MNEGKVGGEKVSTHQKEWSLARKGLFKISDFTSDLWFFFLLMIKFQGKMSLKRNNEREKERGEVKRRRARPSAC